jgi:nitrite reductase/ring-hydroxylating ferredoxin subunit
VSVDQLSEKRRARLRPSFGLRDGWWLAALASEIKQHPKAFSLGERRLAIYRDLQGVVRAVEDQCPHRRLPLSMGRITEDGYLQCAYHGWCFDGATGRCTSIPNTHADEKVPGAIRVAAFATAETVAEALGYNVRLGQLAPRVGPPTGEEPEEGMSMFDARVADGLVLVWTGGEEPQRGAELAGDPPTGGAVFEGRVAVRAPHDRVADALAYNPGKVLGLGPLIGSGDELGTAEVVVEGDAVTARRSRLRFDLPRVSSFDPFVERYVTARVTSVAATGLTSVEVGGALPVRVVAGISPVSRYQTTLRWRAVVDSPVHAAALRALGLARRATGRSIAAAEAVADVSHEFVDEALDRLRTLRAGGAITPEEEER